MKKGFVLRDKYDKIFSDVSIKGVCMSLRVSAVKNSAFPIGRFAKSSIKNSAKQNLNKEVALLAGSLGVLLPASEFLNKTYSLSDDGYVYRDGQWYEKHMPQDSSDYYHETPCSDPYQKPTYIPGS